jgi:hypothetical protein
MDAFAQARSLQAKTVLRPLGLGCRVLCSRAVTLCWKEASFAKQYKLLSQQRGLQITTIISVCLRGMT